MRFTQHALARRVRALTAIAAMPVLLAAGATSADAAAASHFVVTKLVSDQPGVAPTTDPNLVNPWGLVASTAGPWWTSDNGTGLSTLYSGAGAIVPLVVAVPPPAAPPAGLVPGASGIVFNGGANFVVSNGTTSGPAAFIFSTEDGTISGWSPAVDRTHAIRTVDNFGGGSGAVYKGLALASNSQSRQELFATNFRSGRIDVFDTGFKPVTLARSAFVDPFLPDDFAPFGIASVQGNLFVTYAKQNATKDADVAGRGNGFVDVFNTDGRFLRRFASRGALNSPWGLAVAPAGFGSVGGDLLVGNFGNGRIHAFKLEAERGQADFAGTLSDATSHAIAIDGLWALQFGNGGTAGPTSTLFFTAGPNNQTHGLLGSIVPGA
jgi:uncharacterized protein (TIGR03118 family)